MRNRVTPIVAFQEDSVNWKLMLRPLVISLKISGIYASPSSMVEKIYCSFISIVFWLNVARLLPLLRPRLDFNLVSVSWYVLASTSQTLLFWSSVTGKIDKIIEQFNTFEDDAPSICHVKCYPRIRLRRYNVVLFICWVFICINIGPLIYTSYLSNISDAALYPFETFTSNSLIASYSVKTLNFTLTLWGTFGWLFPILLYGTFAMISVQFFSRFNDALRENMSQPDYLKKCLVKAWLLHQRLCKTVELGDSIFYILTGVVFVFSVIGLTTLTFLLINNSSSSIFAMISLIYWLIVSAASLLVVLTFGSILHGEIYDIANVLFEIVPCDAPEDIWRIQQLFMAKLVDGSIGWTCMRLFAINRDTSLTVIGALATYSFILIQFGATGTASSSITDCKNSTSV